MVRVKKSSAHTFKRNSRRINRTDRSSDIDDSELSQNSGRAVITGTTMAESSRINGLALLSTYFEGNNEETEYFFRQFEEVANIANWNNRERLTILKTRLKGNALRFLISDQELSNSTDYAFVTLKLRDFFKLEKGIGESQIDFANCYQRENEDVKLFAHRLVVASNRYLGNSQNVVSESTREILDKMRLSKFIGSLLPQLQCDVLKANPTTFQQAVDIAKNIQVAINTVTKFRINSLQTEGENVNSIQNPEQSQTHDINNITLQNATQQRMVIDCIFCASPWHLSANCEKIKEIINATQSQNPNNRFRQNSYDRGSYNARRGNYQNRGRYFQNNNQQFNQNRFVQQSLTRGNTENGRYFRGNNTRNPNTHRGNNSRFGANQSASQQVFLEETGGAQTQT